MRWHQETLELQPSRLRVFDLARKKNITAAADGDSRTIMRPKGFLSLQPRSSRPTFAYTRWSTTRASSTILTHILRRARCDSRLSRAPVSRST